MNPTKGVLEAIDVARATRSRLLIAAKMSEPGEISFFEREVAARCVDGIEYLGEVNAIEKYRLLGAATALLNPIQWPEPFGLVMIEALATGTPVVVVLTSGRPYNLGGQEDKVAALVMAFAGGQQGGPALADEHADGTRAWVTETSSIHQLPVS